MGRQAGTPVDHPMGMTVRTCPTHLLGKTLGLGGRQTGRLWRATWHAMPRRASGCFRRQLSQSLGRGGQPACLPCLKTSQRSCPFPAPYLNHALPEGPFPESWWVAAVVPPLTDCLRNERGAHDMANNSLPFMTLSKTEILLALPYSLTLLLGGGGRRGCLLPDRDWRTYLLVNPSLFIPPCEYGLTCSHPFPVTADSVANGW